MITIQNGKLNIPDDDRFVGFAGDNTVITKHFYMIDHVPENSSFTLCLRFDDDIVRTVPLEATSNGAATALTWTVRREQIHASGVVAAQIRVAGSDGSTSHSTKDFFLIGPAVELDEDGEDAEFVTTAQLRNSINQAMLEVSSTAPYIGEGGNWYVYEPKSGEYMRTGYHVSGIAPDSAVSDSSENTVSNKAIKQYVDSKAEECNVYSTAYTDVRTLDKVPITRRIASLELSSDIGAPELMDALRSNLYRTNVLPDRVSGVKGMLGIGPSGEVFFCNDTDNWVHLVNYESLYEKMDLVFEADASEIDGIENGSIFFCGGTLYVKFDDTAVALAKASDVYTKAEIDSMIGDVESLLAAV